ncbi:hypothetical protein B4140_3863 [Bacillus amyloliquefaciens]|nr:hypothetical protein B4140_3863 [Bacillus amyloliquefaciens]
MFVFRLKGKKTSTQNKKGAEEIMSQDNGLKDKVKGGMNKMKGEAKDKAGDMANKSDLKAEGKKDKAKGSLQKGVGKTKDKLSDD